MKVADILLFLSFVNEKQKWNLVTLEKETNIDRFLALRHKKYLLNEIPNNVWMLTLRTHESSRKESVYEEETEI